MRAAAAQARLLGPTVKEEMNEEDEIKDEMEYDDVQDPHLDVSAREQEMKEMDDDERSGLRGGWEGFVKRERSASVPCGIDEGSATSPGLSTEPERKKVKTEAPVAGTEWTCMVCTFMNNTDNGRCGEYATRGVSTLMIRNVSR